MMAQMHFLVTEFHDGRYALGMDELLGNRISYDGSILSVTRLSTKSKLCED